MHRVDRTEDEAQATALGNAAGEEIETVEVVAFDLVRRHRFGRPQILAVARAAGEVAPLILVGVVKLAPNLPLDFNAPFLHLERKFMHLGFHIYDVGFQSPNVEAARPLVYATALMLVVVIAVLNLTAIGIRNRLREKFRALDM